MSFRRNIAFKATGPKSTAELANLQEKRNILLHRIINWQKTQDVYMPLVSPRRKPREAEGAEHAEHSTESQELAEAIKLFLPSACPSDLCTSDSMKILRSKESELRYAQAQDALAFIRKFRRILMSISGSRHSNVSGTGNRANTRMRSLLNKFHKKIKLAALRYRAAYQALLFIDSDGPWKAQLRVLHDEDIRGPGRDEDDDILGEGRREMSWIWLVASPVELNSNNSDADTKEVMRVEWARTKARAQRWSEEVRLLQEEMRRVLEYFAWKAQWWREQSDLRIHFDDLSVCSGIRAYAEKQAVILETLAHSFAVRWSSVLKRHGLKATWQLKYDKLPRLETLWKLADTGKLGAQEEEADESSSEEEEADIEENQGSDMEVD